jgi:hypothetical protein
MDGTLITFLINTNNHKNGNYIYNDVILRCFNREIIIIIKWYVIGN